jgi:GLPGLI family protein
MKNKKQIFVLFLLMFFSLRFAIGQETINEGKIVYEITYPDMEMDAQMAAMMPSQSVVYIKSNWSRTETAVGMGISSVTIMNSKTNEIIALMDMMGTKTATVMKDDVPAKGKDKSTSSGMTFKPVNETKEIAGMVCKKAIMNTGEGEDFTMYYTDAINSKSQFTKQWKDFKGFPMEYVINSSGFNMKMTAKSVSAEKVDDDLFKVPADYKILTQEEFSKMMGGQ